MDLVEIVSSDAYLKARASELAIFLDRHAGLPEENFWRVAGAVLEGYEARFPQQRFDLRLARLQVGKRTNRRMFHESDVHLHWVENPLAQAVGVR